MKDIPIKKRKLWNRSVSPPPQTCLQTAGEPEQLSDGPGEVRNARNVPMDEIVASLEPDSLVNTESDDGQGLLLQVDNLNSSTIFLSDENDGAIGESLSLKTERLHWNLNVMMDEWEEPSAEIVNQQISNSEYVTNDGIQNRKVTSDSVSSQKIADPEGMLLEAKGPDSEKNVLQESSGLINTEKTCAAFETQDPTMVISMNDFDNEPRKDNTKCEFMEQENNTANIPVEDDKDMSRTPATLLCKLSSRSDPTKKNDSVSSGTPILGKPACYVDSMKDGGSEDLKLNSGKDPKLTSKDLSSGCNNSNVSGNNTDDVVTDKCMSDLQTGYDSPMEDGELREPDAYFWKNNEVDYSETRQLDNGLVGADSIQAFENNYKNGNQLCDHQDNGSAKGQYWDLDDNGSRTREFRARKYRKKISSYDETPYNGSIQRKNFAFTQRQRKNENGCEVDLPVIHQESRSYDSRSYRDSKYHDHSRLRRVNSGPPARGSEMSFYENRNRQFSDKFPNEIHGPSTRKRLPADRDDSFDSYRRAPPLRGKKKRNKKKKSGSYQQRGMGAFEEENNERLPEKYWSRRDQKSSTNFDQAAQISEPYKKSQSESSLWSPTHVLTEQDQSSSGTVSRHNKKWRGNQVEFSGRLKSDGNLRFSARHESNSQVIANGRECSFENINYNRNIHHGKFQKQVRGTRDNLDVINQS